MRVSLTLNFTIANAACPWQTSSFAEVVLLAEGDAAVGVAVDLDAEQVGHWALVFNLPLSSELSSARNLPERS